MSHCCNNGYSEYDGASASGCVQPTTDPCATTTVQATTCPNGICDDRYVDMPTTKRMTLWGIVGRCLYKFASRQNGFLMSDDVGQFITNRPCVKIPFLKKYLTNPETSEVLLDSNGEPLEGAVPEFASIIAADECGCQNRIQGTKGSRQSILWNGTAYEFVEYTEADDNPLLDPDDVPIVDYTSCPSPLVATLVPTTKTVTDACGTDSTQYGYVIGGMTLPFPFVGMELPWAGDPSTMPSGFMNEDGAELDKDDYPDLFAILGYAHGGSGNTFRLPDFRGKFLRGVDSGTGTDPDAGTRTAEYAGGNTGDAVGSYQEDSLQCFVAQYDRTTVGSETVNEASAGPTQAVGNDVETHTVTDVTFAEGDCGEPRWADETRPKNTSRYMMIYAGCAA